VRKKIKESETKRKKKKIEKWNKIKVGKRLMHHHTKKIDALR